MTLIVFANKNYFFLLQIQTSKTRLLYHTVLGLSLRLYNTTVLGINITYKKGAVCSMQSASSCTIYTFWVRRISMARKKFRTVENTVFVAFRCSLVLFRNSTDGRASCMVRLMNPILYVVEWKTEQRGMSTEEFHLFILFFVYVFDL